MQGVLGVVLFFVRFAWTLAATAVWKEELRPTCSDVTCPEAQCWKIALHNPFQQAAAWTAQIDAPDARDIAVRHPSGADVVTDEHDGHYYAVWPTGRRRCTDDEYLELCLRGAASPAEISITYDTDSAPCETPRRTAAAAGLPQFVMISWDDAFSRSAYRKGISRLLHENLDIRDSCGGFPRHTFFVTNDDTDYAALNHALTLGAEYALHTVHHEDVASPKAHWKKQLQAGLKWARRLVPSAPAAPGPQRGAVLPRGLEEKAEWRPTGVRAPWLQHSSALYEAMEETDEISYDSSIPRRLSSRIWPYPLKDGAHDGCDGAHGDVACPQPGVYSRLWEVPINPLHSALDETFFFDPEISSLELYRLLKHQLQLSYEGSRAPMTIALHAEQFFAADAEQRLQALRNFFQLVQHEYAAVGKTVVFATARDVVRWMKAGSAVDSKEDLCSYFALPYAPRAPSPDHAEVCDGWDNDGDGRVDEFVVNRCRYPLEHALPGDKRKKRILRTCAACPFHYPTDDGPEDGDDGRTSSWKGRVEVKYVFWLRPDGRRAFKALISVENPHHAPSQEWTLFVKTNHIDVTSFFGVELANLQNEAFSPTDLEFVSKEENSVVEGYGVQRGVEVGGVVQGGKEDKCIDWEASRLKKDCWKVDLLFEHTNGLVR